MSISESEVQTARLSSVGAVTDDRSHELESETAESSAPAQRIAESSAARPGPPYRTISDHELTLVQICCDFVCACIALPLALVLLSLVSAVAVNGPGQLVTNIKIDSLFPVAVIAALALGGVYRVTHRRLQPSAFLEMRELSFGVGCGCVLALAIGSLLHGAFGTTEPFATQLVAAVIMTIAVITIGPHDRSLLSPRVDHDAGTRRGCGDERRPHHVERPSGPRHDPGRAGGGRRDGRCRRDRAGRRPCRALQATRCASHPRHRPGRVLA